jgi:hypothetical protein
MPIRLTAAMLAFGLAAGLSAASMAQEPPATDPQAITPPPADCTAETDPGTMAPADGGETLTETLAPCDGVLRPPSTGDGEIVEPSPPVGRTPVIPPEGLPDEVQPADPQP